MKLKSIEEYNCDALMREDDLQLIEIANLQPYEVLNESFIRRLVGGIGGMAAGRIVAKTLIKGLGIDPRGLLGKILSSRMVHIAIGSALLKFKKTK